MNHRLSYETGRITWGNDIVANLFGTTASAYMQDQLPTVARSVSREPETLIAPSWVDPTVVPPSVADSRSTADKALEKFVNLFSLPGDSVSVDAGATDVTAGIKEKIEQTKSGLQEIVIRIALLLLAVLILAIAVNSFVRG